MSSGPRDLLVTVHAPVRGSGRAMRTYGLLRALAVHRDVDVLYVSFGGTGPDDAFRSIPRVRWHPVVASCGARRALTYATSRIRGVPDALARGVSPELLTAAAKLASSPDRGRVIADGPSAAAALSTLARQRPIIYNAHNLESGFRHELSSAGLGSRVALQRFEERLLARSEESWMVSSADMAAASDLCPTATLRYVPNVVDVTAIRPVPAAVGEQRAIFVASFSYEPNLTGLRFLLDAVMPEVWQQLPLAKLALVGAGLAQPPSDDSRIESFGFVEDLSAAYATSSCAVVPLLQGGGTPLKLVEALAYGLPVITTTRAAAGLEVHDQEHCLIADGPERFAAALITALSGGAVELGQNGRQLALRLYSVEALSRLIAP